MGAQELAGEQEPEEALDDVSSAINIVLGEVVTDMMLVLLMRMNLLLACYAQELGAVPAVEDRLVGGTVAAVCSKQ
eukprot:46805-Eustigmatos_ZCMA.PRE.1